MRSVTVIIPLTSSGISFINTVMTYSLNHAKYIYLSAMVNYIYKEKITMDVSSTFHSVKTDIDSELQKLIYADLEIGLGNLDLLGNTFSKLVLDGVFTNGTFILVINGY